MTYGAGFTPYGQRGGNAYRAASWGNQANFQRQNAANAANLWNAQAQNMSRYSLGNRQLQFQQQQSSQDQKDKFLRFGVNALAGLM